MEQLATAASLNGLPAELRLKVYSYVLSDVNVVVLKPGKFLHPEYATGLFTVNKKISSESLAYFHVENAFVVIRTNLDHFLNHYCLHAIPLITDCCGEHAKLLAKDFQSYALKINYRIVKARPGSALSSKPSFAVFAGRHLSNFVRTLNSHYMQVWEPGWTTKVDFTLRTNINYFEGNTRVRASLIEGMKGLRKIEIPFILRFYGNWKADLVKEVKAATNLPCLTMEKALEEATLLKERGNAYYRSGDYNSARGDYTLSCNTIDNFHELVINGDCTQAEADTYESLLIALDLNTSLLDSHQHEYKSAIARARRAWTATIKRPGGDISTLEQKAKLQFRIGAALADDEQFGDAIKALEVAAAYTPENGAIGKKIEEVKVRLVRSQRQSMMKFRENLLRKAFS